MTDEEAFSEAFREHYPAVLAFARRRVGQHNGEDIAAEAFTVAWRRWDSKPADVRPWLFGIAKNVINDHRRGSGRRDNLALRLQMQPVDQWIDQEDWRAQEIDLSAAWASLPESDREVIALVAWDGLTSVQAARVLSVSRVAYAARLSRARARLRRRLHRQD